MYEDGGVGFREMQWRNNVKHIPLICMYLRWAKAKYILYLNSTILCIISKEKKNKPFMKVILYPGIDMHRCTHIDRGADSDAVLHKPLSRVCFYELLSLLKVFAQEKCWNVICNTSKIIIVFFTHITHNSRGREEV